jgi:hypothetical protein
MSRFKEPESLIFPSMDIWVGFIRVFPSDGVKEGHVMATRISICLLWQIVQPTAYISLVMYVCM